MILSKTKTLKSLLRVSVSAFFGFLMKKTKFALFLFFGLTLFKGAEAFFNPISIPVLTVEQQLLEKNINNNQPKIMLFSQTKIPVYLGCINCAANVMDSISNPNSVFGSKSGAQSISNSTSLYGAANSNFSACNPNALYPPIVENNFGAKYGLLTLNTALPFAMTDPKILALLKKNVCKNNA